MFLLCCETHLNYRRKNTASCAPISNNLLFHEVCIINKFISCLFVFVFTYDQNFRMFSLFWVGRSFLFSSFPSPNTYIVISNLIFLQGFCGRMSQRKLLIDHLLTSDINFITILEKLCRQNRRKFVAVIVLIQKWRFLRSFSERTTQHTLVCCFSFSFSLIPIRLLPSFYELKSRVHSYFV